MRKLISALALAALSLIATGTANAEATGEMGVSEVSTFQNQGTRQCMDDSYKYGLRGFTCNGGEWQRWVLTRWKDGTYQLKNGSTQRCIFSSLSGTTMRTCDSSREESWYVTRWNDGTWQMKSQSTGDCLEHHQYGLRAVECTASTIQSWYR